VLLDASHHLNGSSMRNENQFPDSGHLDAALHEAVPDPDPTFILMPTNSR